MRRFGIELLKELFWVLILVAHATNISVLWNMLTCTYFGIEQVLRDISLPLIIMITIGTCCEVTDDEDWHWTDHIIATVRMYTVVLAVIIALHIIDLLF